MADIDLENAVSQFYEDESLTDALTDQPAAVLLQWGEGQLQALAAKSADEEEFDQQFKQLRRLIRSMSEYIAEHHHMAQEEQQANLQKMSDFAQTIGFKMKSAIGAVVEQQKSLADVDSVNHLLNILAGEDAGEQPASDAGEQPASDADTSTSALADNIADRMKGFFGKIKDTLQPSQPKDEPATPSDTDEHPPTTE